MDADPSGKKIVIVGSTLKEEFTSLESTTSRNVKIQQTHNVTFLLTKTYVKFTHKE